MFGWDEDERDAKRTLGTRDKERLWERAGGKCEACGKRITPFKMEVGHKTAWSKRGRSTLGNSVCLCHDCNKKQGTDSWATFMKKEGKIDQKTAIKERLQGMTLGQLKLLAKKHNIMVSGSIEKGDWFTPDRRIAPSKSKYVSKLSRVLTLQQVRSVPKEAPKKVKKKRRPISRDSWW